MEKPINRAKVLSSLTIAALCLCSGATGAAVQTYASVRTSTTVGQLSEYGLGDASLVSSSEGIDVARATARADASKGTLKAFGIADWRTGGPTPDYATWVIPQSRQGISFSNAVATWYTPMLIRVADPNATVGTLGISASFDGRLFSSGGTSAPGPELATYGLRAQSEAVLKVSVDGRATEMIYSSTRYNGYTVESTYRDFGSIVAAQPKYVAGALEIPVNKSFLIAFSLEGKSSATTALVNSFGQTTYALDRTAYWGGISSLTVGGLEVPFTIESAGGSEWLASYVPSAVPEPSALWMAVAGVSILAFRARKRVDGTRDS